MDDNCDYGNSVGCNTGKGIVMKRPQMLPFPVTSDITNDLLTEMDAFLARCDVRIAELLRDGEAQFLGPVINMAYAEFRRPPASAHSCDKNT